MLENEYDRNSHWSTAFITHLAGRLNLNRTKVYKWNWDKRKKELHQANAAASMGNNGSATDSANARG